MHFIKAGERIKYYRDLLHITQKELVKGRLSTEMVYLLENNKRKLTPVTASILISNFHEIANEKGIRINLELKDLLMSDIDYANNLCNKRFEELELNTFNESMYLEIIELAKQYNLNYPIFKAYEKISSNHYTNGNYSLALKYYEKLLSISFLVTIKDEQINIINKTGTCCYMLNNYNKALFYYKMAYEKFLEYEIVNSELEDKLLYNLALCNIALKNYDTALMYINNLENITNIEESEFYTNLILKASIFMKMDRTEEALDIYKEVLKHDIKYLYIVENNMAVAFMRLGRFDESIEFFTKSINNQLHSLSPDTTISFSKLAEVYQKEKKYEEAFIFYGYSLDNAKKFKQADYIIECYESIYYLCREINKINKFHFYYNSIEDILKDISLNDEQTKRIKLIGHNYISSINY